MLKILYFSGRHQFFQMSPGIKSLYDRGKNFITYCPGRQIWDRGDNFSKFVDRGNHLGASHRGTWTGVYSKFTKNSVHLLRYKCCSLKRFSCWNNLPAKVKSSNSFFELKTKIKNLGNIDCGCLICR